MLLSSILWGTIADKYGRRRIIIISIFFLAYFAFLSSFSPSFKWLLLLRFLVGVYVGAVPQALVLYAEYMPTSARGKGILILAFYWAFGASFEALLAWGVMTPELGWRYLLAISSLPLLIVLTVCHWIPESFLYLAATGQRKKAEEHLHRVSLKKFMRKVILGRFLHFSRWQK